MYAVLKKHHGNSDVLYFGKINKPEYANNCILVKTHFASLNRADILQRKGKYPPPAGASEILGLEVAGEVVGVGRDCHKWKVGDYVFGLLSGGGYAEYATIHEDMAISVPKNYSLEQAAAIPEVFMTAFQALKWLANFQKGENVLIHAGGSGVGTAAIQLARCMQASSIIVTASSPKHKICQALGATQSLDYRQTRFLDVIGKNAVDVVIDFIAAPYWEQNMHCLKLDGRLVLLAGLGGLKPNYLNLAPILIKRLHIIGSTLRSRTLDYQIRLKNDFWRFSEELFYKNHLKPVIDSVWDWKDVKQAHDYMEANKNTGKIVLKIT